MFVTRPTNAAAMPGDKITLTCEVDANPRPSYKWYKLDQNIHSLVGTASNLTIEVSPDTAGQYECVASAKGGHYAAVKSQATIFVKAKPDIKLEQPEDRIQKAFLNGVGQVQCFATSVPTVEMVEWFDGNEPIVPSDENGKYTVQENRSLDSVKSTLIIRKMAEADFKDYTCKVTNSLGTDVATFSLVEQGRHLF